MICTIFKIACEQALHGRQGELATMSLELNISIENADAKCWLAGNVISNDVTTLGTCFSMSVYVRTCFRFTLIGGNLTAQLTGSHR